MAQILKNNVSGVLALALGASATSMTLLDASSFPTPPEGDFYLLTLIGLNANGQESNWEVVKVTGKASNTLIVVRAQEGTTAAAWPVATIVQMRLTAGSVVTPDVVAAHIGSGGSTHAAATTSAAGFMSAADKTKLDGVAPNANNYTHPTGDANMHVPATGTTNNGKVLTAGATPGSASWVAPLALGSTAGAAPGTAAAGAATTAARSDHVHPAQTSVPGNAGTATKLAAAVKINGVDFDGSQPITVNAVDSTAREPAISTGTTAQYWRGDKIWRDLFTDVCAATLTGLSTTTNAVIVGTDTVLGALGKLQKQVSDNLTALTSHTGNTSNPHSVTKAQVGLGSVDNTADSTKVVLSASKLTTARTIAGTSFDGQANVDISYANLVNKPTLGTAAATNTPATGNAAFDQVVLGSDTRLSDARTPMPHNQDWSTISGTPTTLSGYGITDGAPTSHVGSTGEAHGNATTTIAGFMSADDKAKLDGLAEGANNYIHPTEDGNLHVPATGTSNAGKVLTAGATPGSASWQDPQAAGLQYLTEVRNTTAPNATVPVHGVQATGTEANIDLLLQQKGTGAIVAQVPDGTTAGGNKRGANAVDLQTSRTSNTHVALGLTAVIAGGANNRTSGTGPAICGGGNNVASSAYAFVGGGQSNSATSNYAVAAGGASNTASGSSSAIAGGDSNTASGVASAIPGGRNATTNSISGLLAYGFNAASQGQTQMAFWGGRKDTTDAASWRLTSDGATSSASNQLTLRNNSTFIVKGAVVARNLDNSGEYKSWSFNGTIRRGASAADTVYNGTTTAEGSYLASGWGLSVAADTTNGSLSVSATGVASKSIRWFAVVHSIEVA